MNVYLTFSGKSQVLNRSAVFTVMVGDNPPTIKGGYAKYTTVDRPLQRGLTVFTGYDPMTLAVEVRFGVRDHQPWAQDDRSAEQTETHIGYLDWMGGLNNGGGPPPLVYLSARDGRGHKTNLIPPPAGDNRPWTISDITWGASWRNPSGNRVWQDATVTLQQYIGLHQTQFSRSPGGANGAYTVATPPRNTPLQLANHLNSPITSPQQMARRIMADPKNNPMRASNVYLSGKSIYSPIPKGAAVWIPLGQGAYNPENALTQINPLTSLT